MKTNEKRLQLAPLAFTAIIATTWTATAVGQNLVVTVESLADSGGTFLTPLWFGFHDGSFNSYDQGAAASAGLERLAEDGVTDPIAGEFDTATSNSGDQGVVLGGGGAAAGPIDPGETASVLLTVNPANRYFSYASMVIPSNDAFIANGDSLAHEAFDSAGKFTGPFSFIVLGSEVLDAGTEQNTEMEAAFINQTGPDMGDVEGGTVGPHPGFIGSQGNPGGTPIILSGTAVNAAGVTIDPAAADFTQAGFEVARITVSQVPEPASLALLGCALIALGAWRRG